jgi:hypothetical protein
MKFSIGDKVVTKKPVAHTSYSVDVVVGYLDGAVLTTGWGDGFDGELRHYDFLDDDKPGTRGWHSAIHRYQESELSTPEEYLEELHKLEAVQDKLSEEFEGVRASIQAKLDAAAVLVNEAAAIAKPFDRDFEDLRNECRKLYEAQDANGWRSSHIKC